MEHGHDLFSLGLWVHARVLQEAQQMINDRVVLQVLQNGHEHRFHVDVVAEKLFLSHQEALVFKDGHSHVLFIVGECCEDLLNWRHLEGT